MRDFAQQPSLLSSVDCRSPARKKQLCEFSEWDCKCEDGSRDDFLRLHVMSWSSGWRDRGCLLRAGITGDTYFHRMILENVKTERRIWWNEEAVKTPDGCSCRAHQQTSAENEMSITEAVVSFCWCHSAQNDNSEMKCVFNSWLPRS